MSPQQKEPPTTGFRYTPSAYLHRVSSMSSSTSRSEKPWNSNNEDAAADYHLSRSPSGTVATSKKSSNIEAHFVSDRMQKRKDLYRGIIKGDYEIVDESSSSWGADGKAASGSSAPDELLNDVEYSLNVLSREESSTSLALDGADDEGYIVMSEQARQARQRRLSSGTVVVAATSAAASDSEAAKARSLRAQRLRQVKKETLQEDEHVVEKLRLRRMEQLEEERRLLKEQAEQEAKDRMEQDRLQRERAILAEERRLLEQEKRKQARERDEQEHQLTLKAGVKKQSKKERQQPDPPADYSLMEEVHMLMRESGVFKTCVSSCFGEDEEDQASTVTSRPTSAAALEPPSLRSKANRYPSFNSKGSHLLSFGSGLSDLQLDESGNVLVPKY